MPNPARTNHGCSETCHSPMRGSGLYIVGPMSSMPRHGFATPLCWRRWVGVEHQAVKDKHDPTCARAALSAISGSLSAPCYDLLGPLNETHPMEYFSRLRPDSAAANPGLHGVGSTADLPLRAKAKMGGKLTKLSAPPGPMALWGWGRARLHSLSERPAAPQRLSVWAAGSICWNDPGKPSSMTSATSGSSEKPWGAATLPGYEGHGNQ